MNDPHIIHKVMGAGKKGDWDDIHIIGSIQNPPKMIGFINQPIKSVGNFHTSRHHKRH